MKVITKYPLYVNRKRINPTEFYMNLDGKSSKNEIKRFQKWVNKTQKPGVFDEKGIWSDLVKTYYDTYGKQYDSAPKTGAKDTIEKGKTLFDKGKGILDTLTGKSSTETSAPAETPGAPTPDGNKPMSKTTKIVLIAGGVALLGVILYFATKKPETAKAK